MSVLRHVPPAYSPVAAGAIAAGVAAALGEDGAPRVRDALERAFGPRDVLLTSSGTAALALALRACAAGRPGCPVALPAWGCYDLATAADGADLSVILYDVHPSTLAPEPRSLRQALAAGPCAVVVAHFYGVPVDVAPLAALAAEAGALLVEDAAQGAGAAAGGRPAGALGPLAVLSFGRGKGRTGGAGGALLAHDGAGQAALRRARVMVGEAQAGWRDLASAAALWMLGRPPMYALPAALPWLRLGETRYHPPSPPRRISRAAAAVLAAGWGRSAREAEIRRVHAARLMAACHAAGVEVPRGAPGAVAGWLRLPVLTGAADEADAFRPGARRLGIAWGYPRALCDLEGFRPRVRNAGDAFPGARRLAASLVTLPTHSLLHEADLLALEGWIAALTEVRMPAGATARAAG